MRRRIDMGAVLADHFIIGGPKAIFRDRVGFVRLGIGGGREFGLAESGPDWRIGAESVGQVDHLLARDNPIDAIEIEIRTRLRRHAG